MNPRLVTIFAGYAFGIEYKEERGHAYMLTDQEESARVTEREQPGACLHCHSSVLTAYYDAGVAAGAEPADDEGLLEPAAGPPSAVGFDVVNAMPYDEANALVDHPISCVDCHDPETNELRITRPAFFDGIRALASLRRTPAAPAEHRALARRRGDAEYDPNTDASRQELRSFVCAQCHVEYYFQGEEKRLTYPWREGCASSRWRSTTTTSGTWTGSTRSAAPACSRRSIPSSRCGARASTRAAASPAPTVTCPTCEGRAVKVSDHHVRSPLLNSAQACQVCHPSSNEELIDRAETIQERTEEMLTTAEEALVRLIEAIERRPRRGADEQSSPRRAPCSAGRSGASTT
jgi:nitrite reductase (cytochrome c-552)